MNERIKQLWTKVCQSEMPELDESCMTLQRQAKFSELIVKDLCVMMEMAEDDAFHCFDPSERPTEYIEWLNQWQTKFEKHFGVDE